MRIVKRFLNWIDPSQDTTRGIAEEENLEFDRHKVDEQLSALLKAAEVLEREANAFIVIGKLAVRDVVGEKKNAKAAPRHKTTK